MDGDFDGLKKWLPSIKLGLFAVISLMVTCFIYGCFNPFRFWHAFADAGLNSAIAHTLYYTVFAGPILFAIVTLYAKFFLKK